MFNFKNTVHFILNEATNNPKLDNLIKNQPGSTYFANLFNAYNTAFGHDIANDPNLVAALALVATSGQRFPARNVLAQTIPILDAFEHIHDYLATLPQNTPGFVNKKTTLDALIDSIVNALSDQTHQTKIKNIVDTVTKQIQSLLTTDPLDYQPTAQKTRNAWQTLTSEFDKLSQTAIEQLGRDTIQGALQKIITKRTSVANRIMSGKGFRKPFQSTLLIPLFDFYKNYTTGGGILYDRITGDFKDAVDQLTIDKVISVAILSGDYYLSLLRRQLAQLGQQNQQQTQASQNQQQTQQQSQQQTSSSTGPAPFRGRVGTYDSLYNFDKFIKNLLNEAPLGPTGLTKDVYDGTARAIGTAKLSDFRLFVNEGKSMWLPETQQQTPTIYNLETISKDNSKEALNLYKALKSMAYYTRETPGFKERTQFAGQAGSALAAFGGAKLYQ